MSVAISKTGNDQYMNERIFGKNPVLVSNSARCVKYHTHERMLQHITRVEATGLHPNIDLDYLALFPMIIFERSFNPRQR